MASWNLIANTGHYSFAEGSAAYGCAWFAGDVSPRRIVCLGFCAAGSVSTLAAAWAAVQWPTADVRSISFGAPACGNAEFAATFQ